MSESTAPAATRSGFRGEDVVRDYIDRFSNWGRWGPEDELGALNHVGPDQVKAAAQLVRQGKVVSMTLPYDLAGPQVGVGWFDSHCGPMAVALCSTFTRHRQKRRYIRD